MQFSATRFRIALRWLTLSAAIGFLFPSTAAAETGLLFRKATVSGKTYLYEVFVPPQWTAKKKWPVILFLHGTGHRGEYDAARPVSILGVRFLSYTKQTNAIIVFPRCRADGWWSDADMEAMTLDALEQSIREFNGDRKRLYLTGLSMGGYGTWLLASRLPGKFAAIAVVCGGIRTPPAIAIPPVSTSPDPYADVARRIGKTPVWIFHGSGDDTVPVEESRRMVQALRKARGDVRYTEYPGVGHNSWDLAYAEPQFFPWLLSHRLPEARSKPKAK